MRVLIFLLSIGFTPSELKIDRVPSSSSPYTQCDSKVVAAGINGDYRVPRGSIYHYGKRDVLLKDVRAGNVPQEDWNQYIMGEETRFKLKRYRRGLYGTEYVEDADRFGDRNYNWLMEIKIKKSCLVPIRVSSLIYLPWSSRFKDWFGSKRENYLLSQWIKHCFYDNAHPRDALFDDYRNPSEKADYQENVCEKVVADYFEDLNYAFVQDAAGDLTRSWYIRDRNCIEEIKGSDLYWASEMAKKSELWENTCHRMRDHRNNVRIWFASMANAGYTVSDLELFERMIQEIKPPEEEWDWQTDEVDRFAAQDFAGTLSQVARRCHQSKNDNFRKVLRGISENVDQLQSSDVKITLESACR